MGMTAFFQVRHLCHREERLDDYEWLLVGIHLSRGCMQTWTSQFAMCATDGTLPTVLFLMALFLMALFPKYHHGFKVSHRASDKIFVNAFVLSINYLPGRPVRSQLRILDGAARAKQTHDSPGRTWSDDEYANGCSWSLDLE